MIPYLHIPVWVLGAGLAAFASMLVLTPLVIHLARWMDWLAYPTEDRWHQEPTALMGGMAIFASVVVTLLVMGLWWTPWPLWLGAALMFITGVIDDRYAIAPAAKILAQVVATGLLLYAGYVFAPEWPVWVAVPLTFLWVIGITNAVNLLDNMDGLAAGIAAIISAVLAVMALMIGAPVLAAGALVLAGAAAGFLVFNYNPARIFMGDGGSLFLGYSIAALAVILQGQMSPGGFSVYVVSVAVLAVPIFDTTLVTLARTRSGRSVSQGGRDHSSHRLVFLGLSERKAVGTLYTISLLFGVIAFGYLYADVKLFYALLTLLLAGLGVLGVHLGRANVYEEGSGSASHNGAALNGSPSVNGNGHHREHPCLFEQLVSLPNRLVGGSWKPMCGVVVDVGLVVAAFTIAHFLRFESGLTAEREAFLLAALPFVIAIKLPVFYYFRLYHAIWRYAGTMELVRILKATSVSSILTYGVLVGVFGAPHVALGAIVIDWMVITFALAGVRFGFRGLRQYLAALRTGGSPTLLVGTGPNALAALRSLRGRSHNPLTPAGFLDTDPANSGRSLQGLPVYAIDRDLHLLCEEHEISDLVITDPELSEVQLQQIVQACLLAEVRCHTFLLTIRPLDQPLYPRQLIEEIEAPGVRLIQRKAS